jgi:DNA replication protein DnaC
MMTPCAKCGNPFEQPTFEALGMVLKPIYCQPCVRRHDEEAPGEVAHPVSVRESVWQSLCDPEFRTIEEGGETDAARLQKDFSQLAEVTGCPSTGPGLIIQGPTATCKTRSAWRLLRRIHDEGGRIRAMTSGDFGREFADAAGKHHRKEWFDSIANATAFFLDDLGKSKWTPAVWAEFFEVIDARGRKRKVTIITTNDGNQTLETKAADPVLWDPLLRRLREFTLIKA